MAFQYISNELLGRLIRDREFRDGLLAIEPSAELRDVQRQVDGYLAEQQMGYTSEETREIAEFLKNESGQQAAVREELGLSDELAM